MLLRYCPSDFEMVPAATIIIGSTLYYYYYYYHYHNHHNFCHYITAKFV
jgi:hypothetical protein